MENGRLGMTADWGFFFGGEGDGTGRHGRDPAAGGEEGIVTECGYGSDSGSDSG